MILSSLLTYILTKFSTMRISSNLTTKTMTLRDSTLTLFALTKSPDEMT